MIGFGMAAYGIGSTTDRRIRGIVHRELAGAGVEASVGEDHAGNEAIIAEIIHDASEPDLDPERVAALMMAVNRDLYHPGEHRFADVYDRAA